MRGDIETSYRSAEGRCLDAMYALRGLRGDEAIECLNAAIRTIEHGKRLAAQERRRETFLPKADAIQPPVAPLDF